MKTILVPLEESPGLDSQLETALLLALRFGSYVEGVHVRPELPDVGAWEGTIVTPMLIESFKTQDQEHSRRMKDRFEAFMQGHGIPRGPAMRPSDEASSAWLEEPISGLDELGRRGRVFDIIVAGRPGKEADRPATATVETALFEAGRAVLISPPTPLRTLGETVVIAWNGSTESARTTTLAFPLLRLAKKVVVLTIRDGMVSGPSGIEAARHLSRNGIEATTLDVTADGRTVGVAILAEAAAVGADLLIKSAYTHSRLRQMIFGGATNHILVSAEVPVFMAH
ncbi:MAG: universal stress protein [Rhodospirillales bacterium]|nr:universal stress protein [Rhodospirillales bacterium]